MIGDILKKIFGTKNDREINRIKKIVAAINSLEPEYEKLTNEDLKAKTVIFKERLAKGETLDDILVEAFATVREASKRTIGQTPVRGLGFHSEPLSAIIKNGNIKFEEGQVWRRNRIRTMTVQADVPVGVSPLDVRNEIRKEVNEIKLPKGYKMEWLGEYSEQLKNVMSLLNSVPVPVIIMFLICVLLFASIKIPILIFSMLPLCLIGIVPGLFITLIIVYCKSYASVIIILCKPNMSK